MPNVELLTVPQTYDQTQQTWFDDYVKAFRQRTEVSIGGDNCDDLAIRMRRTSSMPSVVDAMSRTNMERIRHYNYDLKLSKLQKRALRFTWHRLQTRNGGKRVDNVFEEVYERLMRIVPVMREMFTTRAFLSAMSKHEVATPRDHAKFTVKMIDAVIKNLDTDDRKRTDTLSEFDPVLIGRAHACLRPYGFISSIWEKLGETIIDVVLIQDAVRDLPGAGQAWVVLTACLVDQLRAGFEQNREYPRQRPTGRCPMQSKQSVPQQQPPHSQPQRSASPILDLNQATEQLKQHALQRQSPPKKSNKFQHQQSLPYPYMDEEEIDENVENVMRMSMDQRQLLRRQQEEDLRVAEAIMDERSTLFHQPYKHCRSVSSAPSQPMTPHSSSPVHAPIASMDKSGSSSRCASPASIDMLRPYRPRSPSHAHIAQMEEARLHHRVNSSGALEQHVDAVSQARRRSQPIEVQHHRQSQRLF